MTVNVLAFTIAAMAVASFSGGFFFKTYSISNDILHLIIGFCAYGIETRAGMVPATVDSITIMDRISRPYQPQASQPLAGNARNMEHKADAVVAKAAKQPGKSTNQPQPEIQCWENKPIFFLVQTKTI